MATHPSTLAWEIPGTEEPGAPVHWAASQPTTTAAVATGLENASSHFNPKEGQRQRTFKLPYKCAHLCSHVSKVSKVMLKILQARLHRYVN